MKRWLVAIWLVLMFCIQLYYFPKLGVEKGASVGLSAAMLIMAFPSSLLVFVLGALIVKALGVSSAPGSIVDVMVMQIFVVVGYIQWFVVVPKVFEGVKRSSPIIWVIVAMLVAISLYWLHRFLFPPLSV